MTPPDDAWLDRCRRFGADVLAPTYATYDRENRFPAELHEAARSHGILDQDFPVHLGGAGLDDVSACAGAEHLASRRCPPCTSARGSASCRAR